jgi:hypothetical protein
MCHSDYRYHKAPALPVTLEVPSPLSQKEATTSSLSYMDIQSTIPSPHAHTIPSLHLTPHRDLTTHPIPFYLTKLLIYATPSTRSSSSST